ncbi:MAG TPA: hypothetical protein VMU94_27595 [Streptosporangiaceae bacterium]|nr:hypothetical protein [Streptosporangiaceae bacterium]
MHPRIDSALSAFRHTYARASARVRQSSRLMLGAAAATAVVAAGVAVSVSAGPAPAGAASAISRAAAASVTHHARVDAAAKPASSRHAGPAQHSPAHAPTKPEHTAKPAHAAKPQHTAKPAAKPQHRAPARHAAPRHAAPKPYLIYDSVTPSALPRHNVNAVYATGNYAASQAQVSGRHVMWIDTTGSDHAASILDVEPGDATPSMAANWARQRLAADPHALARIYTMRSEWSAAKAAIGTLPAKMRSHVRWWIADPTGHAHIVPGSDATQWYWGSSYDITTATPRF